MGLSPLCPGRLSRQGGEGKKGGGVKITERQKIAKEELESEEKELFVGGKKCSLAGVCFWGGVMEMSWSEKKRGV